jgi:plastocyanin
MRGLLLLLVVWPFCALAQSETFTITIREHRFQPAELAVPAGKKFQLVVDNQDATPEEFESLKLRVEKLIPGKAKATLTLGPLKPGAYPFVGEFHESTAKGTLTAK